MKDCGKTLWYAAVAAICALVGFLGGDLSGTTLERRKAVEAGVARWEANAETGAVEFKYGKGPRKEREKDGGGVVPFLPDLFKEP